MPSPEKPDGHFPQVKPTPGAVTSLHATPEKHGWNADSHPSLSFSQCEPEYAAVHVHGAKRSTPVSFSEAEVWPHEPEFRHSHISMVGFRALAAPLAPVAMMEKLRLTVPDKAWSARPSHDTSDQCPVLLLIIWTVIPAGKVPVTIMLLAVVLGVLGVSVVMRK